MPTKKDPRYFVFDVESVGLHGEAFAVAWCIVNRAGEERGWGMAACDPYALDGRPEDFNWLAKNVPLMQFDCANPREVRQAFWDAWHGSGDMLAADVAWPVEARFLTQCVDDDPAARWWEGPYPLIDIASVRLARGLDPLATVARLPHEEPAHNPLADARQSARLLIEALNA